MERKNFSAIIKRLLSPHLYYSNFSTTRFRIAISRWGSRGQLDNWKMLDRGKIFISLGWISLGLSNALRFVNASREIPFNSLVKIFQLWAISFGNRNIVSREGRMGERERKRRNEEGENGLNRCLPDKFLATIVNFASRISRQRSMEKNANEGDEF